MDWGERLRKREVTVAHVMSVTGKNIQTIRSWKRNLSNNRDSLNTIREAGEDYTLVRGKKSMSKRKVSIGAGLRTELPKLVQDAHFT